MQPLHAFEAYVSYVPNIENVRNVWNVPTVLGFHGGVVGYKRLERNETYQTFRRCWGCTMGLHVAIFGNVGNKQTLGMHYSQKKSKQWETYENDAQMSSHTKYNKQEWYLHASISIRHNASIWKMSRRAERLTRRTINTLALPESSHSTNVLDVDYVACIATYCAWGLHRGAARPEVPKPCKNAGMAQNGHVQRVGHPTKTGEYLVFQILVHSQLGLHQEYARY